jgi:hypothetical protein
VQKSKKSSTLPPHHQIPLFPAQRCFFEEIWHEFDAKTHLSLRIGFIPDILEKDFQEQKYSLLHLIYQRDYPKRRHIPNEKSDFQQGCLLIRFSNKTGDFGEFALGH